jgi:hypothetical protein
MALFGMGAGGVGESQEGVRKDIESLSRSPVIMVGIGLGINEQKQGSGGVLVSEGLMLCGLHRVREEAPGPCAARQLGTQVRIRQLTSHVKGFGHSCF